MNDLNEPPEPHRSEAIIVPPSTSTVSTPISIAEQYAAQIQAKRRSYARLAHKRAYEVYEIIFRNHHMTNTAQHHGPYEHYRLVYRYGYELGTDARYADAEWASVEHEARPRWEERNPGTWEQFKDLIQYAWNTGRTWEHE